MRRNKSRRVGMVTGVYDILHCGHLNTIEFAKESCDYLIVGINSDRAVRILKGDSRPINCELNRKRLLEAIRLVDKVYIVDDINMVAFLKLHRPNLWVKGADYDLTTINAEERVIAETYNIEILFAPKIEGLSTTNIITKQSLI